MVDARQSGRGRLRLELTGMVQGVGFRPFVHRLASAFALTGWVSNDSGGVIIEVEGAPDSLSSFCARLMQEAPPHASLRLVATHNLPPRGGSLFEIRSSTVGDDVTPFVLPDLAICEACRAELFDPTNRRYRHPFISCTHCGPRFSILHRLPYDRPNTSMASFRLCAGCRVEYEDPGDRRFHAQPIACHDCGPRLVWWDRTGQPLAEQDSALIAAANALRDGAIVAVKGIGGFHLFVDARSTKAVQRLRERKGRDGKPFAVMVPDLATARGLCDLSGEEEALLQSPAAPIVLARRRRGGDGLAEDVAPGLACLGLLLPYSPLHCLLMADLCFPVVATSGNRSEEPICIDEQEALRDLSQIADYFLVHDRPIVRHLDDSIVRVLGGVPTVLRRGRGWAPAPIPLQRHVAPLLAVGAHQKNTVALAQGRHAILSQHLGDLETEKACAAFEQAQRDLKALYQIEPESVAFDLHPDYVATRHAQRLGLEDFDVQHHHAHIVSCMAENRVSDTVLGVALDGTGFGLDGSVWGGEFLLADEASFQRVASLRPFPLPGGEQAVREPRRVALALLSACNLMERAEAMGLDAITTFTPSERTLLLQMMEHAVQSPLCSSAGRLFDGVASLLGLCQQCSFEGEAAMRLEAAAAGVCVETGLPYAIEQDRAGLLRLDWRPMVAVLLEAVQGGGDRGTLAAQFHFTLAMMIVEVAQRVACPRVALSGGCFQNALLVAFTTTALRQAGFEVLVHRQIPPNDGGIALGQLVCAAARLEVAKRPQRG